MMTMIMSDFNRKTMHTQDVKKYLKTKQQQKNTQTSKKKLLSITNIVIQNAIHALEKRTQHDNKDRNQI